MRTGPQIMLCFCRGVAAVDAESTASWSAGPVWGWRGFRFSLLYLYADKRALLGEGHPSTQPRLFVRGGRAQRNYFCGLCDWRSFWALWHAPLVARVSWQLGITFFYKKRRTWHYWSCSR
ncbi:hypothetical protein GQ55_7G322800 [Panicum hallii var. hallii]|uniref:Secreted protein n=1 Tax=Panicum hallii var. hallii TaxID=1504633 RepID=A0A2T7D1B7_9POAL|nr:hypothetical protein GQ55_7G322800 [Panicum hallii var. hallii]